MRRKFDEGIFKKPVSCLTSVPAVTVQSTTLESRRPTVPSACVKILRLGIGPTCVVGYSVEGE